MSFAAQQKDVSRLRETFKIQTVVVKTFVHDGVVNRSVQKLIDAIVSKRAYMKMHARSQRLNACLNDSLYGVIEFVVSANFDTSRASRR